jgi:anti-sigma factor ChrR (cupin superfamily)
MLVERTPSRKESSMKSLDLDSVAWRTTKRPGISIALLWRDESTHDAAVLIRMDPGCRYPLHRHVGDEDVLVLQSGFRDDLGEYATGTFHRFPAGSVHAPTALDAAIPCVLFAVARGGIEILD